MSSIGTALLESLCSIERSGDLSISGMRHVFMPTIDVDNVGRIALPVVRHLRQRIAEPLEPPKDLSRENPLKCSCPDCRGLGAFLLAPTEGSGA